MRSGPGTIMPPRNTPSPVSASTVIVVPTFTTTQGPWNRCQAPISAAQRSAPSWAGRSYELTTPHCRARLATNRSGRASRRAAAASERRTASPATLQAIADSGRGSFAHRATDAPGARRRDPVLHEPAFAVVQTPLDAGVAGVYCQDSHALVNGVTSDG